MIRMSATHPPVHLTILNAHLLLFKPHPHHPSTPTPPIHDYSPALPNSIKLPCTLQGLTPTYYSALLGDNASCLEFLLSERGAVGLPDEKGWQEIHHVSNYT